VAEQSGGTVRIESQPGEGTSIKVFLPRANVEATSQDVEQVVPIHAPVQSGQVVLVVDDDSAVREVTATLLASVGYGVIEANSGAAALDVLGSGKRVDLMLVDIAMPDMNGIETERQALRKRPDLPVLFSTGHADLARFGGGDIDRRRIVGKPYRRDDLFKKVRACLSEPGTLPVRVVRTNDQASGQS
jgi:CheY-like chemotaxis protein